MGACIVVNIKGDYYCDTVEGIIATCVEVLSLLLTSPLTSSLTALVI